MCLTVLSFIVNPSGGVAWSVSMEVPFHLILLWFPLPLWWCAFKWNMLVVGFPSCIWDFLSVMILQPCGMYCYSRTCGLVLCFYFRVMHNHSANTLKMLSNASPISSVRRNISEFFRARKQVLSPVSPNQNDEDEVLWFVWSRASNPESGHPERVRLSPTSQDDSLEVLILIAQHVSRRLYETRNLEYRFIWTPCSWVCCSHLAASAFTCFHDCFPHSHHMHCLMCRMVLRIMLVVRGGKHGILLYQTKIVGVIKRYMFLCAQPLVHFTVQSDSISQKDRCIRYMTTVSLARIIHQPSLWITSNFESWATLMSYTHGAVAPQARDESWLI